MLSEPVLESDISATFYPDATDLETIKTRNCEYTIGRLPDGEGVVKRITSISIALKRCRNQHKCPWSLSGSCDHSKNIDEVE